MWARHRPLPRACLARPESVSALVSFPSGVSAHPHGTGTARPSAKALASEPSADSRSRDPPTGTPASSRPDAGALLHWGAAPTGGRGGNTPAAPTCAGPGGAGAEAAARTYPPRPGPGRGRPRVPCSLCRDTATRADHRGGDVRLGCETRRTARWPWQRKGADCGSGC